MIADGFNPGDKMIKKQNYSCVTVFLTALFMSALIALPVMLANKGNFYLVGDYMSQQIPFINECRRVLKSGTPFWSANTFLGANFIGSYSFYNIASPFYWPIYLMPESLTGFGTGLMFAVKHAVAALTPFAYLKKHTKTRHLAFIGALIYSFSFFAIDSTYYYHFQDVIAVFPLIPLLTDEVMQKRKQTVFSFAVLLNAMINYYFFVATSVFFLIYLFFRTKYGGYKLRDAVRCIVYYALGAIASAFILLPSALALLETYKATSSFSKILITAIGTVPQLFKILKGLVLPSEGILNSAIGFDYSCFNSNAAFLPFFGAVFLIIALKTKSNEWHIKLIKFLLLLSVIPFGNGLFSFFTNMYYTRWWYSLTLIGVLVSIILIENGIEKDKYKFSAKVISIISAAVLSLPLLLKAACAYFLNGRITDILPQAAINYLEQSGLTQPFSAENIKYALVLVFLVLINYLPLFISVKKSALNRAKITVPAVILICTLSYTVYLSNEADVLTVNKNAEYKGVDTAESEITEYTSRSYYDYGFANYPSVINKPGITAFHSFKSHSTAAFSKLIGYDNTLHTSAKRYFDTPAIQSVLSIENITEKNSKTEKAPYYVPFGWSYEYYVISSDYKFTDDKSINNSRIELMTKACFIDNETAKKLDDIIKPLNKSEEFNWKDTVNINRKTAATDFLMTTKGFTAKTHGEKQRLLFFSIPHDNGWKAYINGKEAEIYTINAGLMGVVAPEGDSEISFEYITPGLNIGLLISFIAIIALFSDFIYRKSYKKRHS